jgi:benzoate-CoA ligase family protein
MQAIADERTATASRRLIDPRAAIEAIPRAYNFADDILCRNLRAGRAAKTLFIDPRGTWTYGQVAERVGRFGAAMRSLGVRSEERILLALTDTVDWPTAFLGAIKAGIVPVPVGTLMTEDDYRFMLADSRARVLVVSEELLPKFVDLIGSAPDLMNVIVSGENGFGHRPLEELLADASPEAFTASTTRDDICFWLYTSGSTGRPKGVVHAHASLRLTADLYGTGVLGLQPTDVCYSVGKLFFAYGLGNSLTFPMAVGATAILSPEHPSPASVAAILREHRVTAFYAVPTFYAAFLAGNEPQRPADLRLRYCISAGEALPAEIGRRWKERYKIDILDGLGTTEMLHIFLSNNPQDVKYGTTGRPVPGYELRLIGDAGDPITAKNQMGELQVRGPTAAIMYWNDRERSRKTFLGEWTRTGDKYMREDGDYYVYCGREDDMFKVGGIYVSPIEVEGALCTHPDVLQAAVVGWPDEHNLVKPKALVVLKSAEKASDDLGRRLQEHVKARLAHFKSPHWIEFCAELPKTANGKVQRFKLRPKKGLSETRGESEVV